MAGDRRRKRPLSESTCVLVACAWFLVACTDPSAATTTTSAALGTAPEPEALTTSTTSALDPTVNVCGGGTIWEAGVTHVAPCFFAPLAIVPPEEGWRTPRAGLDVVEGFWVAPGEREPAIRYVILAYRPDETPAQVVDSIVALEGVDIRSGPSTDIGVSVEIETAPIESTVRHECVVAVASALHLGGGQEPGHFLIDRTSEQSASGDLWGLGACRRFAIWAIPIDDITVTVVATTDDLDRFDELMPRMQRLVDTITVATP